MIKELFYYPNKSINKYDAVISEVPYINNYSYKLGRKIDNINNSYYDEENDTCDKSSLLKGKTSHPNSNNTSLIRIKTNDKFDQNETSTRNQTNINNTSNTKDTNHTELSNKRVTQFKRGVSGKKKIDYKLKKKNNNILYNCEYNQTDNNNEKDDQYNMSYYDYIQYKNSLLNYNPNNDKVSHLKTTNSEQQTNHSINYKNTNINTDIHSSSNNNYHNLFTYSDGIFNNTSSNPIFTQNNSNNIEFADSQVISPINSNSNNSKNYNKENYEYNKKENNSVKFSHISNQKYSHTPNINSINSLNSSISNSRGASPNNNSRSTPSSYNKNNLNPSYYTKSLNQQRSTSPTLLYPFEPNRNTRKGDKYLETNGNKYQKISNKRFNSISSYCNTMFNMSAKSLPKKKSLKTKYVNNNSNNNDNSNDYNSHVRSLNSTNSKRLSSNFFSNDNLSNNDCEESLKVTISNVSEMRSVSNNLYLKKKEVQQEVEKNILLLMKKIQETQQMKYYSDKEYKNTLVDYNKNLTQIEVFKSNARFEHNENEEINNEIQVLDNELNRVVEQNNVFSDIFMNEKKILKETEITVNTLLKDYNEVLSETKRITYLINDFNKKNNELKKVLFERSSKVQNLASSFRNLQESVRIKDTE